MCIFVGTVRTTTWRPSTWSSPSSPPSPSPLLSTDTRRSPPTGQALLSTRAPSSNSGFTIKISFEFGSVNLLSIVIVHNKNIFKISYFMTFLSTDFITKYWERKKYSILQYYTGDPVFSLGLGKDLNPLSETQKQKDKIKGREVLSKRKQIAKLGKIWIPSTIIQTPVISI